MPVVEQVRFSIFSQQEILELQNEVIQLEDLAERKDVAKQKIQQSDLAKRGGIFAPNELDSALPSAITKQEGNSLISRASEARVANSVKSTDKTSAAPFVRSNPFKVQQEKIALLEKEQNRIKAEQKKIKAEQLQTKKLQADIQGTTNDLVGLTHDLRGTIYTKGLGFATRFIPVALAATVATAVFGMIRSQFGSGGLFDTRKRELDSVKSLIGLERETDIIGGGTLFLGNPTLVQGVARNQTSNTQDTRDGQRRFVLRSNGY